MMSDDLAGPAGTFSYCWLVDVPLCSIVTAGDAPFSGFNTVNTTKSDLIFVAI